MQPRRAGSSQPPVQASSATVAGTRRSRMRTAAAAAVLLAAGLLLLTLASGQQLGIGGGSSSRFSSASSVSAAAGAAGQLLLVPTRSVLSRHELLYQLPARSPPRGLVLLLHKCGRSASDHWPRSAACPECLGLPESLSKLKQALGRGYAVAAMSSADRSTGGGGRCWKWADDAAAVAAAVRELPAKAGLPPGAPVFVGGASSGGSLALRLPQLVRFDGAFGEVIAPAGMADLLAKLRCNASAPTACPFPPAAYVHMPADASMAPKVAENLAALRALGLPAAEIKVPPRALYPGYFADRSPAIPRPLSFALLTKLKQLRLVDSKGLIAADPKDAAWSAFRSYLASDLKAEVARLPPAQRLEADARVVEAHIWECVSLAWGRHETVGEYLTAVLAWLEGGGKGDIAPLARRLRVPFPASLAVPAEGRPRRFHRR